MAPLVHAPDPGHLVHLEEAARVLALPIDANGMHWHPFGVYALPLARRVADDGAWVRRLHVWHPDAQPVGERSPYGVHTHSGLASSHVLAGTLRHHLYTFRDDDDGVWRRTSKGSRSPASLLSHVTGQTVAGTTHTFPANHPHGVGKGPGWAISLFEQRDEPRVQPFTTWQRSDGPAEALLDHGPVSPKQVLREVRTIVDEAIWAMR